MENELKSQPKEEQKQEDKQPQVLIKRQIIITIQGNNINIEKCETASVFELQAILENILRKLSKQ